MASIYIKNGWYYYSFYDQDGKRYQRTTKMRVKDYGKREGERMATRFANNQEYLHCGIKNSVLSIGELLGAIDNLSSNDKTKIALALSEFNPNNNRAAIRQFTYLEVRDKWLEKIANKKNEAYFKDERSRHSVFFTYENRDGDCIGTLDIKMINTEMIDDFILDCEKKGKAPNTIKNYLKPVNQVFKYALANDLISKNPNEFKQKISSKTTNEWEYINDDALDFAIENADRDSDKVFWTWLRYTGMNPKDISLITMDKIEDNTNIDGRNINNGRAKNGRIQRIPLNDKLEEMISEYGDYCFGLYKTKTKRDHSNKRFKKLILKKGVNSTLALVRHTFLTNLIIYGELSLDDVAIIAGHIDTKMLKRVYIKKADQIKAHQGVNKLK